MRQEHRAELTGRQLLGNAAGILFTVLLAFAAFDDITTDNDTNFTFEWFALALCAGWLFVVSWRLLGSGHRWLGSVSVVVLVAAVGAGSSIGAGVGPAEVEYLTTFAGFLWFLGLAGILTVQAWRQGRATRALTPR